MGDLQAGWAVVKAMGRAFPLLLDKSIQRAESRAMESGRQEDCLQAWAEQVYRYIDPLHIIHLGRVLFHAV
jgi:hypothetical protein